MTQVAGSWQNFKAEVIARFPSLQEVDFETADLVFGHGIDIDSMDEMLSDLETSMHLSFGVDLRPYYPGWFSPFLTTGPNLGLGLSKIRRRLYPVLTPIVIWDSVCETDLS